MVGEKVNNIGLLLLLLRDLLVVACCWLLTRDRRTGTRYPHSGLGGKRNPHSGLVPAEEGSMCCSYRNGEHEKLALVALSKKNVSLTSHFQNRLFDWSFMI